MAVRAERTPARHASGRNASGWSVVLEQELRDLWFGGRGLPLILGFSLLLSVIAYLTATNTALNLLEQRESVSLTLQVAIAVGALLTLLAGADAVSGERERGTLETLLLAPVSRRQLAIGKLLAAGSLWLATWAITVPYVWFLGRGVAVVGDAVLVGLVVGTLLAIFLAGLGLVVSFSVASNRVSLALGLLVLLALFAPGRLPSPAQKGWVADLLLRLDPMTAGEDYVSKIVVHGHAWSEDVSLLVSPIVAAAAFAVAAVVLGERFLRLGGGSSG
jgi:ABC-2 type transport system permease protein